MENIFKRIEAELSNSGSMSNEKKLELLNLIQELRQEMAQLSEAHKEDAQSLAFYAESSLREATRQQKSSDIFNHTLEGFSLSAKKFEISHPKLTTIVNNINQILVNIGI